MFSANQRVVCIDASEWQGWSPLKEGSIYTIREVCVHDSKPALHLHEIPSVCGVPYFAYRFRPLVERKTDISFAIEILRKAGGKVPA